MDALGHIDTGWKGDGVVYEHGKWQSLEFVLSIDVCHAGGEAEGFDPGRGAGMEVREEGGEGCEGGVLVWSAGR